MKIGFIGNLNNFNFCIVRYLRDRGYDAELLLLNEPDHFKPHSDSYNNEYEEYTSQLNWNWRDPFIFFKKSRMLEDVAKYDRLAGINFAPAYCQLIGRKLDIFIPAGSDIYRCPFEFFLRKYKYKTLRDYYYDIWARLQRKGIKNSNHILYDKTNEDLEEKIKPLNISNKRTLLNPPFLYYPQYFGEAGISNLLKSTRFVQFQNLRKTHDFIVFQHCRQDWFESKMIYYYKGNEKLIQAFAEIVKNKVYNSPLLVVFEYGKDVDRSKKLISELGIVDNVLWMPLSLRKDIMAAISFCDIGVGELGEVSWLSYATVYEFICMKKPFIGYRKDELYGNYSELYPMYSTNTTEGVYSILKDYKKDKNSYLETGEKAFKWFVKYAIEDAIDVVEKLFE